MGDAGFTLEIHGFTAENAKNAEKDWNTEDTENI